VYGCYDYHKKVSGDRVGNLEIDEERGVYPSFNNGGTPNATKASLSSHQMLEHPRPLAGFWSYAFQIIFQVLNNLRIYHFSGKSFFGCCCCPVFKTGEIAYYSVF